MNVRKDSMSQTLSLRVPDELLNRIDRYVRKQGGATRPKCIVMMLEEHIREMEFPGIEFRDTILGRQACVQWHMEVWQFIMLGRVYDMDVNSVAEHLGYPVHLVEPAFKYYAVYKSEIDVMVDENENMTEEKLRAILPNLQVFPFPKQKLEKAS